MTRHRTNKKYGKWRGGGFLDSIGFGSDSASGTEATNPKDIISQSTKQIQDLLGKITDAANKMTNPVVEQTGQQTGQPQVVQNAGRRRRRRTQRKHR
jgi:hypothetical protein